MRKSARPPFHRNVILLSVVSFLNDIGGETIKKIIPLFLSDILHVPTAIIGLVEGVGESVPFLSQPVSGYLSDLFGKRKPIIILGQILRSQVLWLVGVVTWPQLLLVRLIDRSGKGIANAPRDALVTESSDPSHVGRSFGLNRLFDNAGAVIGLTMAAAVLFFAKDSIRITLPLFRALTLFAAVPSLTACILLFFFIHDIKKAPTRHRVLHLSALKGKYLLFLFCSFLFTLGNSSDAFIVLKAQSVGITLPIIFLLVALYSFVSSAFAVPLSMLSDRFGRKILLFTGWIVYAFVYICLANIHSAYNLTLLVVAYGLYNALTEGSARAYVSDLVVPEVKGTAFGVYFWVVGVTLFIASLLAGVLWQVFSPEVTFYFGAFMAGAAALVLVLFL